jgi:flavin-dependent dehydrogenase
MVSFATQAASATEFTALEALADGWWYAAPLPAGRWVAGFFTDSDLFPHCSSERRRFWFERWRRTSLISGLFPEVDGTKPIHVVSAASRTLDRVTGRGWLAVGDAARSYDPLSGQGITKALESALAAAEAIAASSAGDAMALDRFAHDADREWQRYRAEHAAHYARERRWPYSVFWRRRRC